MSLSMGQVPVTGTVPVFTVPPGPVAVTMYAAASGVYVGTSTALTTSNGMSVSTSPVRFTSFPTSQGAQLYATTGNTSSTVALYYLVSSAR